MNFVRPGQVSQQPQTQASMLNALSPPLTGPPSSALTLHEIEGLITKYGLESQRNKVYAFQRVCRSLLRLYAVRLQLLTFCLLDESGRQAYRHVHAAIIPRSEAFERIQYDIANRSTTDAF